MYIYKVEVENFRNFGDQFILELKPYTLILGENSSGKTNLLCGLALIFSQDIFTVRTRRLEIDDFNYGVIKAYKESIVDGGDVIFPEIVISAYLTDFNEAQQAAVGDWFIDKTLKQAKITYHFHPSKSWSTKDKWIHEQRELIRPILEDPELEGEDKRANALNSIDLPLKHYDYTIYGGGNPSNICEPYFLRMFKFELLDALRDAKKELAANKEFRLLFKILNHEGSEVDYSDIRAHLIKLDKLVGSSKALKYIKANVDALLKEISLNDPLVLNEVDFNFFRLEHTEILKNINLQYGDAPIAIERNGLGRNNLLFLSLILSHLYDSDTADTTVFRAVGIEEPEAHLHPQLEDHLAYNLERQMNKRAKIILNDDGEPEASEELEEGKRDDLQIIATSHSSHIAAGASLENLVTIYRNQTTRQPMSHWALAGLSDSAPDRRTIRYLKKYLDATKSTLFFARKIMFVEGIAEQTLIPVFYKQHTGHYPSYDGGSVINVQGIAFRHFLKVVTNGYFLKCAVMTDDDHSSRASKLKTDFEENYDFIKIKKSEKKTFEIDLIETNKSGDGKQTMLAALKLTAPRLYSEQDIDTIYASADLDAGTLFTNIVEARKADFAFNVSELISNGKTVNIPAYITDAIDFISSNEDA